MAEESILKKVVARLKKALSEPSEADPDMYKVRGYDVRVLFETIKRYGGRKDWTPTEDNIEQLPGPVRRYIYKQRQRINELEQKLVRAVAFQRKIEDQIGKSQRPPR